MLGVLTLRTLLLSVWAWARGKSIRWAKNSHVLQRSRAQRCIRNRQSRSACACAAHSAGAELAAHALRMITRSEESIMGVMFCLGCAEIWKTCLISLTCQLISRDCNYSAMKGRMRRCSGACTGPCNGMHTRCMHGVEPASLTFSCPVQTQNPAFDSYTYLDVAHRGFEKPSSLSSQAPSPPTSRAAPSSSSSYLEELTAMKPLDAGGCARVCVRVSVSV